MAAEIVAAGLRAPRRSAVPVVLGVLAAGLGLVVAAQTAALAASPGAASIAVGGQHSCATCTTSGAASCTITGLANGTTYDIAVVAHTTVGDSGTSTPVTVVPWSQCPCSLWPSTAQPSVASANDISAVNLGVQVTPSVNGWIIGIRFYKSPANTGTHTGQLWTTSGSLLGQVTFTGESASGWQEADFASPIAVTAGTTYVASYFAPNGGYSYTAAGFAGAGVTSGPLTAPQSSAVSGGNGVYNYGSTPSFPGATYNANNYWVDVVFTEP